MERVAIIPHELTIEQYHYKDASEVLSEVKDTISNGIAKWREDNAIAWNNILATTAKFKNKKPVFTVGSHIYAFLHEEVICVLNFVTNESFSRQEFVWSCFPSIRFIGSAEYAEAVALILDYLFDNDIIRTLHLYTVFDKTEQGLAFSCNLPSGISAGFSHRFTGKIIGDDVENNKVLVDVLIEKTQPNKCRHYLKNWKAVNFGDDTFVDETEKTKNKYYYRG